MESASIDRWRRVQELFEAAADLAPGEQAAYLAAASAGDDGLRQEVEALLRSDAEAGSFIEHAIRRGSGLLLAAEPDPLASLGKIGKYEILGRIGEGGFGVVYKGRDPVLQRYVAVKTCSSSDEKLRRRFFREGQIAAGLQHPNITTVHDLGVERGIPYLVQEFLDGEDLNHKIARREDLGALRRLDILAQVARGLEYAHLQGVLHRDVKPANIRILPAGAVKIMDFGIAKLLHEVSDVTTQGVTLGTVGYLAPEQLRGEEVDRRTDIFSFGVLVYELLTYERPWKGSTFSEVSYRLLNEEPAAFRDLAPTHSPAISELVSRCLAKDPRRRYDSFTEVIAVLEPEIDALRSGAFQVPLSAGTAGAAGQPVTAGAVGAVGAMDAGAAASAAGAGAPRRRVALPAAARWLGAAVVLAVLLGAGGRAMLRHLAPGGARAGERGALTRPPRAPGAAAGVRAGQAGDGAPGRQDVARMAPAGGGEDRPGAVAGRPVVPGAVVGEGAGLAGEVAGKEATGQAAGRAEGRQPAAHAGPPAPAPSPGAGRPGTSSPPGPASGQSPRETRRPPAAPGRHAAAGAAVGAGAAAEPRVDVEARRSGAESGPRTDRPAPAAASEPAGAASAGESPAAPGDPGEEPWRAAGAGTAGGPGGNEAAVEAVDPNRPMARGDLIPPGASGAVPPRLLSRPEPPYPDRARRRRVEADVLMLVLVDENGHVSRAIVKRTDDPGLGFNEAARRAALRASFSPASRDGLAGKMWTELPFSFRLHPGD